MAKVTEQVAERRRSSWEKEPAELRRAVTKAPGTFNQSFFPAIYSTEGSRHYHSVLVTFRTVLLDSKSDLLTVKMILKTFLEWVAVNYNFGGMLEAGEFLTNVAAQIDTITTRGECLKLIEELALYVGRLHYWLDEAMPWFQLVETYEKAKRE